MKKINTLKLVFILLILSVVSVKTQEFPGDDWTFNKFPEQNGWKIKKLKEYRKYITDSTKITGLVIVQIGRAHV